MSEDEWEEVDGVFSSGESWTTCYDDCEEPPSHVEANGVRLLAERTRWRMKSLTVDTMPADEARLSQEDEILPDAVLDSRCRRSRSNRVHRPFCLCLSDSSEEAAR